jgi:glucose/arabinose dehydrogenase
LLAEHRPAGLAVAPDGSLYITDDQRGRVWREAREGGQQVASSAPAALAR